MVDRKCNYVGCKNIKKEHEMFPFPVNDWARLNLWLINTGNQDLKEIEDKFICSKHFHWTKFKCDSSGRACLKNHALPRHFSTQTKPAIQNAVKIDTKMAADAEEPENFCVKIPAKVYVRKKTENRKLNAEKKDFPNEYKFYVETVNNAIIDSTNNTNLIVKTEFDDQDEIKIKKEMNENVHTFDAGDVLTDFKTDMHTIDIFNPHIIEVKKEIDNELQHNDDVKELNNIINIKNEDSTELNKLEVQFEIQYTNDPNYLNNCKPLKINKQSVTIKEEVIDIEEINSIVEFKHELHDPSSKDSEELNGCNKLRDKETQKNVVSTQEKIQLTEEIFIKEEYSTDKDVEMSAITDKHTNLNADAVEIKKECIECTDPEVEFVELIECGSNTLDTKPEVLLIDDADKQKKLYTIVLKDEEEPTVPAKTPRRSFKVLTGNAATKDKAGVFLCGPCNVKFHYKHELQQHNVSVHTTVHTVQKAVKSRGGYKPRTNSNELAKYRFCKPCDMKFTNKRDKYAHMSACHGQIKPFECSICFESYKYEFQLIAHKKQHSGKDYRCDHCGRHCKTQHGLANHLNSHTKERMFACPTCDQSFPERTRLLNHLIKHTPNETYGCISCGKTFDNPGDLRTHSREHRTFFPCKVCGAKFSIEVELDDHMKVHTKFLECTFCLEQFKDVGELQRHTVTHQDMLEKVQTSSHSCPHCPKRFLYRSTLLTHVRAHSAERPFLCPHPSCAQRFKTSSARSEHARGHQLLHKCPECGKSFARLQTLALHRRLHTGEKPFACHLCKKAFAQRESLNYHLKKFHGQQKVKRIGKPKDQQKTDVKNQKEN